MNYSNITKDSIKNFLFLKNGDISYRALKKIDTVYLDLKIEILNLTKFLDEITPTLKQRIWYILNDVKEIVKCKNCSKPAKFRDIGLIQEEFCSRSCISKYYSFKERNSSWKNKNNKRELSIETFLIREFDKINNLNWKPDESNPLLVLIQCHYCGKWFRPFLQTFFNERGIFCCSKECKINHPVFSLNGKDGKPDVSKRRGMRMWAWYDTYAPRISLFEEVKKDPEGFLLVKCVHCHNWFRPSFIQTLQRCSGLDKGINYFYCSDRCKDNCPIFKKKKYIHGSEPYYESTVQRELKKIVFERDNYICQICGKSKEELDGTHLCCHHIDPIKNNPIESADIDNCITVCRKCHNLIHTNNCNYGFLSKCTQQW